MTPLHIHRLTGSRAGLRVPARPAPSARVIPRRTFSRESPVHSAPTTFLEVLRWVVMAGVVACVAGNGLVRSEPPVAPLPEDLRIDAAVQPAPHVPAAEPTGRPFGPVSLGAQSASGAGSATPARPVGDWSVLAAIVGAFAVLVVFRLKSNRRGRMLPSEVFDVLGEGSLGGQHAVRVVRFGPRTLLVGISSSGSQTLAEIDDLMVTEQIAAACVARLAARPTGRSSWSVRPATPRGGTVGGEAA